MPGTAFLPNVPLRFGLVLGLGLLALLPACDRIYDLRTLPDAEVVPDPEAPPPTEDSLAMMEYFAAVEVGQKSRGLLRLDGGGPDTPYDDRQLAQTFRATAFAREFTDQGSKLVRKEGTSRLHRWEDPVLIQARFGASVSERQRGDDRAAIQRTADRLASATGHPVRLVDGGGNFHVLVLSEDERRAIGPTLLRLLPDIRPQEIEVVENLDRATYCVVIASDPRNDGVLTRAVAVVRAELPPVLRLSCFHEEIAQGLGLANDSQSARPSIFNDNDEFARLTTMDEKMLKMLYDLRLTPGMDAESAAPIVNSLARSLTASTL